MQHPALPVSESGACVDDVMFERVESSLGTEFKCTEHHYV